MFKRLSRLLLALSVGYLLTLTSCVSYKNIPILQDIDSTRANVLTAQYAYPVIQKSDILGVYINSLSETTQAIFGTLPSEAVMPRNSAGAGNADNPTGYLVDQNGEIQIQSLGKLKVEGLTALQAEDLIKSKAANFVKDPTVVVKILNFKVSVVGDVNKAGVFSIPNNKVNVIEAISMAGDFKITGRRENILVLRPENGTVKHGRVNLLTKDAFESPFFYLQNNDMVVIEPNLQRLENDQNFYRNASLILGALTAIALFYSRLF